MLKQTFIKLTSKYTEDSSLVQSLWNELSNAYSGKNRYYHNLSHIENMLLTLNQVKNKISDYDTVLFALYYHDFVYEPTSDKNEEKSADVAGTILSKLNYPCERISNCYTLILATRDHIASGNNDTNYLTDADLSILGQDWDLYLQYTKMIRQEYVIYPNEVYNEGRKKVIDFFLKMNQIFKTQYFFEKFERQAKENLIKELTQL
jgi:Uncharacterized protein conserved in bacteria